MTQESENPVDRIHLYLEKKRQNEDISPNHSIKKERIKHAIERIEGSGIKLK
jgi:hypothetical protein